MGGKQTITGDQMQFVGYGLTLPGGEHDDYAKVDPKGKIVVWLGPAGPEDVGDRALPAAERERAQPRRDREGRGRRRSDRRRRVRRPRRGAVPRQPRRSDAGGTRRRRRPRRRRTRSGAARPSTTATSRPCSATTTRCRRRSRRRTSSSSFSSAAPTSSTRSSKQKAANQEPLPPFALKGVKITVNVDADYTVVRTRLTHNVVGIVEGSDPKLKDTYVAYGAHYDHVGYREGAGGRGPRRRRRRRADDRINNGADDDGSGTVALMAIARAFALGPRPKRSILFVWHAGEESGLLGSRYNADYPVVPIDKIVAQINMDMVGRNRNDDPKQANTVLVVGSDRISTELHNINEDANASLPKPMTLDYEMNDPADTESIYTRSDHYSYAREGHSDHLLLHRPAPRLSPAGRQVSKIIFEKIQRVAQLAYETGRRVANLDHAPVRDNKGPRVGKTVEGKIEVGLRAQDSWLRGLRGLRS